MQLLIGPTLLTIFILVQPFDGPFQLAFIKVEQLTFLLIAVPELIFARPSLSPIR